MPRADCQHSPSTDPRRAGRCIKCGAEIPPATRDRNPQLERELVEFACKGVVNPDALIVHAQTRSIGSLAAAYVADPLTVKLGMDRLREGREEGADWVNHLVWQLEENPEHPDADRWLLALQKIAEAYQLCTEED